MFAARSDSRVFVPVVLTLVAGAWAALAVWGASPAGYLLDHTTLGHTTFGFDARSLATIAGFVAGWTLMTVAMMLPTIIPLLDVLRRTAGPASRASVTVAAVAGYLAVWASFGVVAHTGDYALHLAVDAHAWLHANTWFLGASPLLLAGTYQFSPLKHICLDKCRSSFSFVAARWRGDRPRLRALRIGPDHGLFCVGCCWALMLLMFAVSAGNLGWMLALAAVMAIEKNAPWGHRLTAPTGIVLLTTGFTLTLSGL